MVVGGFDSDRRGSAQRTLRETGQSAGGGQLDDAGHADGTERLHAEVPADGGGHLVDEKVDEGAA